VVKLLLDEHLSPAIARDLRARGHDVVAVGERADLRALNDPLLFTAATAERRAIVTLDHRGFRVLAQEASRRGLPGFGVVLVPRRGPSSRVASRGALVAALERLMRQLPGDEDLIARRGGEAWLEPAP
jgi:hypothetical protein